MRHRNALDGISDDPEEIAETALEQAKDAASGGKQAEPGSKRDVRFRDAAELGWLAVCSLADIAAERLGLPIPEGTQSRRDVLYELADCSRTKSTPLITMFKSAHRTLHSECFYEGNYSQREVLALLEELPATISEGVALLSRCKRRR